MPSLSLSPFQNLAHSHDQIEYTPNAYPETYQTSKMKLKSQFYINYLLYHIHYITNFYITISTSP